jgi:hypothetical protein
VVDAPLTVWLTPSPKFHRTLLIDAEERLGITVNVIGDPATPTLSDVATETEKLAGFVVK